MLFMKRLMFRLNGMIKLSFRFINKFIILFNLFDKILRINLSLMLNNFLYLLNNFIGIYYEYLILIKMLKVLDNDLIC